MAPEDLDSAEAWGFSEVNKINVLKLVKDINVSKSSGIDNVSSFIIKEAFTYLLKEVTFMFNLSIKTSVFPEPWKKALVVPIPKTGDLTNVKNFRPISLLPLPGKIMAKLIHQQLTSYLNDESLLTDSQYGFRKNCSTIHSVDQLTSYINTKFDEGTPVLSVFVDFRKAFDSVQHAVLLDKLAGLNIHSGVLNWVTSYLDSRLQRVYANGVYSDFLNVTQGVPQGSVLGPLFYIIYANDLVNITKKCQIALYADDTVFYTAHPNFVTAIQNMQTDINALSQWCKTNGIQANIEKTKMMIFGSPKKIEKLPPFDILYDGSPISSVLSYKYLGITLDRQLNFGMHVNRIVASVAGKLKQFQCMRSFLNVKASIMVYKSMMLPILEYGDIFLTAASAINRKRLQILQNKGLRCALGRGLETSNADLHEEANLLKLKYRREQHTLNFMYDMSQIPKQLNKRTARYLTRSSNKKLLKIKRPKTEKFKKSLMYSGRRKWNLLPEEIQNTQPKATFKLLTKNHVWRKATLASENS